MIKKLELYKKAIALRQKGLSYQEILRHIPVGKGTISRWCREIPLTEKQKERLIEKKRNTPLIRRLKENLAQSKKEAKRWAKEKITNLINLDKETLLLLSGILLYWAEGTRREKDVEFTNTDPKMIILMMEFFRKILKVPENKFKIMVRISEKGNVEKAEKFWLKITGVSKERFRGPELLKLNPKSKSLQKYPYGMCRIVISDVSLSRKMLALIQEFSKKFAPVAQ